MRIISTTEQTAVISALDLRTEAVAALGRGDQPGYARSQVASADYTGPVEVLTVGTRAGVALNATAQWGDVESDDAHGQVVVLDETAERYTLDGVRVAEVAS
jgi:hypothetical protein